MEGACFTTIGICILASISVGSEQSQNSISGRVNTRPSGVTVTASVETIRYCRGDKDVYTAHLRLALRYANSSSSKAILYKPQRPIEIAVGAIAENSESLGEKRYEATLQYDQFSEPRSSPDSERPSARDFAILDPGSAYLLAGDAAVPVRFETAPTISGTISPGNHAMTVKVVDWPFVPDDGMRLSIKWAKIGTLYYEAIDTPPFRFFIPPAPHLEDCSKGAIMAGGTP